MKNIKILITLIFLLSVAQISFAQNNKTNGRQVDAAPGLVVETPATNSASNAANANNGVYPSDFDYNNTANQASEEDQVDTYYPVDIEIMQEEMMATTHPSIAAQRMNEIDETVEDLRRICEELRLENQIIRESLSSCCSNSQLGLSASDAYLLQNAPNPFNASSEITYFVPNGLEDVEIRITNIKGETLKSIDVTDGGYGKLEVNSSSLESGSFIYMLSVKGEIVDSKVMIITK